MPLPRLETYNTYERLARRFGGRSKELEFLALRSWNLAVWEDDFMGDQMKYDATAPGTYQSTASGAASAVAAISTGVVNGAIILDAGTADDGRSDLSLGLHFRGDLGALYVARFSIPTLTTRKFEVGFTDVVSGTDAGAVNVKATPSFTATDCAVLVYDTDDDAVLTLVGNRSGTAATAVDFTTVLAAATYYYLGVQLLDEDDVAIGFILDANGRLLERQIIRQAITSTVLLTPWLFVQNRAANAGSMTADWHLARQFRTTSVGT